MKRKFNFFGRKNKDVELTLNVENNEPALNIENGESSSNTKETESIKKDREIIISSKLYEAIVNNHINKEFYEIYVSPNYIRTHTLRDKLYVACKRCGTLHDASYYTATYTTEKSVIKVVNRITNGNSETCCKCDKNYNSYLEDKSRFETKVVPEYKNAISKLKPGYLIKYRVFKNSDYRHYTKSHISKGQILEIIENESFDIENCRRFTTYGYQFSLDEDAPFTIRVLNSETLNIDNIKSKNDIVDVLPSFSVDEYEFLHNLLLANSNNNIKNEEILLRNQTILSKIKQLSDCNLD